MIRAGATASTPQWIAVGWIGFFVLILAAWMALLLTQIPAPTLELVEFYGIDAWRALCAASVDGVSPPALVAMWALMTAAMMAPTAAPALRTYADLIRAGAVAPMGLAPLGFAALIAGYLGVWLGFSALAALLQQALVGVALLDPLGRSAAPWLSAALLALAGLYQLGPLKQACLSRCRAPLGFFMAHWRPGASGAFAMGLRLGVVCVGCCWALMLLAFVFGTMSLAFMGLATLLMTLEKLPELGRPLTRPLGLALLAGAAWTLLAAA